MKRQTLEKKADVCGGRMKSGRLKQQLELQSMIIPGFVLIFIFAYIPLFGIVVAFKDYNLYSGIMASPWVGLKHFQAFFSDRNFILIMRNTLVISVLKLIFGFPAPIILAVLLNEVANIRNRRVFQTITYMPHFISWVVVAGMLTTLLSMDGGTVNSILMSLGFIDEPINFLSNPNYFWTILVSANVWKSTGFNAIIFMAAISGISPDLYEAAALDGASHFRQIFAITLPCIMTQIVIVLILNVSNILNAGFDDILLLTNNGENRILMSVADVVDTYVYRVGIKAQRFSFATAAGVFKSVVNILMLLAANGISRKLGDVSLW
ncbi:MAG: ABC transporter permease [Candidatus Ornithomonoglobus sp.]